MKITTKKMKVCLDPAFDDCIAEVDKEVVEETFETKTDPLESKDSELPENDKSPATSTTIDGEVVEGYEQYEYDFETAAEAYEGDEPSSASSLPTKRTAEEEDDERDMKRSKG